MNLPGRKIEPAPRDGSVCLKSAGIDSNVALRVTRRRWMRALLAAAAFRAWPGPFAASSGALLAGGGQIAAAEPFPTSRLLIASAAGRFAFHVEVATTPMQRMQGLQRRASLPADAGMLFFFDPPETASMWMKDTYIPLDILFIDAAGKIVAIAEDTRPMSLRPIRAPGPVRAVLELNAGTVAKNGIRIGDQAVHPLFQTGPAR